jgi:hypothetical protein
MLPHLTAKLSRRTGKGFRRPWLIALSARRE